MPVSISLSHLSWSTPDGRGLFSDLNLTFGPGRSGLVGRNGVGKSTLLKLIAGTLRPQAGTVSLGGSLGILRQTVQVGEQETIAELFGIADALALLRRAEEGSASIDELSIADWTLEARLAAALARLGLEAEAQTLLSSLSGGQLTRTKLAALVIADPDFILLDEPTNNLDRAGREAVIELMANWRGGAVVVSHDRELLDRMDSIVELTSLGATSYGGNWSHYRERKAIELASARHDLADAERRLAEVDRNTQETAERKARKDSAGRRKRAKGDQPLLLLDAKKERSEKTGGDNARLAERRRDQALGDLATARERIEVPQPFSVRLPSTGLPPGRIVLQVDDVSAGYVPGRPVLANLSLTIAGPERMAITGRNGSGKTTFLSLMSGKLAPWSGQVRVLADFTMLDQQVSLLDPEVSIRDNFRRLNPGAGENACRAALARFMFRADAALQRVSSLSGGQMLRAGLACVIGGESPPALLILDEPTNHLDIDSIEAVEAGLRAFDGALIVVSHDEAFLEAIGITRRVDLSEPSKGRRSTAR
ncbi:MULTISPECIES: ABC-F family ATP-binding cassette domain-containing protein [unclassified Ensifer]|uniref:ABC-F family ATP-binding cassette domain-containing protein n=1 Tax=unclassified Ensifer TaxID=2633371 RepID=UPI000812FC51|nr:MULTISPECIES: ABC-F family ATP-binding cassette domain-containing protein [unclassified Ensifer]OCP23432.1 ABC transporter [Ensifer sp. LC54]OCP26717.1 ABC transporter [Ensifer sp. LC384]